MLSDFEIDLTATGLNMADVRSQLDTLKMDGRLRSILTNKDDPNKSAIVLQLQDWDLSSFVKLITVTS